YIPVAQPDFEYEEANEIDNFDNSGSDKESTGIEPEVGDCNGSYEIQDGALLWELSTLDNESKEAALHFQCHTDNQGDCFFPISVSFNSNMLLSGLQ
ncbi:coatomer subunit delta, partial [Massospora cicadina]